MDQKQTQKNEVPDTSFIPLSEAAKRTGYTPEHLNLLARKGKLQAKKIGRNWHTTEAWVSEFVGGNVAEVKEAEEEKVGEACPAGNRTTEFSEEDIILEKKLQLPDDSSRLPISNGVKEEAAENFGGKNVKPRLLAGAFSLVILMPLVFAMSYFFQHKIYDLGLSAEEVALLDGAEVSRISNENSFENNSNDPILGIVKGEETADTENKKNSFDVAYASENFKMTAISVGTGVVLAASNENLPLEIADVRSESFISAKKDEVKLVVSWKTNKMAMSEIEYSKNNGQNSKSAKEQSYGFSHGVVLAGLEPGMSYVYVIKAKDRWGNQMDSNYFGIYTASKPVSVFDMISKAMNDTFGWALAR